MADFRLTQSGEEVQDILNNSTPQTSLEAETARAEQAEGALQQGINTEAEARQQADTTLQQHIDAETQTRQQQDAALQQLIQQVQASLINYYLKSETYSASQIDLMLAAIKQFRYQVVDVLPTPSADTMGIIYLVPSAHAVSGNIKDEYITLTRNEGSGTIYYFEQIGETAIDLSNYYTKGQTNAEISAAINTALAAYSTTTEMNAAISQAIATAVANYYTKAQTDALIANFITASVNNLVNYYLKSETFTKAEVNQLIATVKQFTYVSVAELPTASAETMNKIYLVPSTNPQTRNVKDEFITISVTDQGTTTYSWEQIGSTEIDLSGYSTTEQMNAAIATAISTALASYYTKSETMSAVQINAAIEQAISTALASYYTKTQADDAITAALNAALASYSTTQQMNAAIATAIANYYTKAEVDTLIANFITASVNNLVNYYLKSETFTKAEVNQLIAAVKQFTYVSVAGLPTASAETMNKIYLVPSTNPQTRNVKDEFITISVTDQGTTTYSWEQIGSTEIDLSGYYTSQQTDAAISTALGSALQSYSTTSEMNAAITTALNTALADYSTTQQMNAAIATAIANYYTKAEVDALIANFITASVNNLVNYYLKSETFTKAEVNQLIAAVKQFRYQSVATLPEASEQTMNIIYLVPGQSPASQNVKDEYITIATTNEMQETVYSWEKIGTTEIDLSNYYTKAQTDSAITTALNAALTDYSTTTQVGTMISTAINTALAQYYNKTQVDNIANEKADRLPMSGEGAAVENHIMTISQDGNIKDGGKSISDLITMMNAITRHTRLTDFDLNVLKQAVADQNLEKYGLKVGDQKTINGHTYVIAGLNPMKGTSTPYRVTANHVGLIVIPHTTQAWNASGNTSTGADSRGAGYLNSDLHYYLKNTVLPMCNTDLGADNLIAHSKLLTNAVNTTGYNRFGEATGCSSGWTWESDCKICALSEVQVYGGTVWSSSGYNTGEACRQLDVFQAYSHTEIFGSEYPWLRDVVSASYAASADNLGHALLNPASNANYVAALILFH